MTAQGRQNVKSMNNYAHFPLRGAPCPTLPYTENSYDVACLNFGLNTLGSNSLNTRLWVSQNTPFQVSCLQNVKWVGRGYPLLPPSRGAVSCLRLFIHYLGPPFLNSGSAPVIYCTFRICYNGHYSMDQAWNRP